MGQRRERIWKTNNFGEYRIKTEFEFPISDRRTVGKKGVSTNKFSEYSRDIENREAANLEFVPEMGGDAKVSAGLDDTAVQDMTTLRPGWEGRWRSLKRRRDVKRRAERHNISVEF